MRRDQARCQGKVTYLLGIIRWRARAQESVEGANLGEGYFDRGKLSYGKSKELNVLQSSSHVIFYYGRPSIQRPFCVLGSELDSHLGVPVRDAVEEVNQHFRESLFAILSG
jgi:hypothetical protein